MDTYTDKKAKQLIEKGYLVYNIQIPKVSDYPSFSGWFRSMNYRELCYYKQELITDDQIVQMTYIGKLDDINDIPGGTSQRIAEILFEKTEVYIATNVDNIGKLIIMNKHVSDTLSYIKTSICTHDDMMNMSTKDLAILVAINRDKEKNNFKATDDPNELIIRSDPVKDAERRRAFKEGKLKFDRTRD